MAKRKPIICLDFDGVLHSYTSGWKGPRTIPDSPVEGWLDFLVLATMVSGCRVAVFSSRGSYWFGRWAMKRWIRHHAFKHFFALKPSDPDTPAHKLVKNIHADTWEPWLQASREAVRVLVSQIEFPRHKPPAVVSIDDRAVRFLGHFDRPETYLKLKPWNKQQV